MTSYATHHMLGLNLHVSRAMPNLDYPEILENFGSHLIPGRVESRALLGWFLENYFRLDETEAQDAVCDGVDDKGVDAIYVDDNLERIVIFQSKLRQNSAKTLGDNDLKIFSGTLDQFKDPAKVEALASSTGNLELKNLIKDASIPGLLEAGYEVRGIFVTNAKMNDAAEDFLTHRPDIAVYDEAELQAQWVPPGDAAPVATKVSFTLDGMQPIEYATSEAKVFVAALRANELVQMDGLQSGELFAWNVRQTLGKTKVNKAIAESTKSVAEHKNFIFYHNGLTVLAEEAEHTDDVLTISGYTVVNGCQSLTTLHENKANISEELKLLTRIVQVSPASQLAAKITRHSNNQNAISARDLQSNSTIQRRLQIEFKQDFPEYFSYEIKRGESSEHPKQITNEDAGRMLLAFDLQQPWLSHQTYRLFDDLHSEIFGRREVTAWRIAAINSIHEAVLLALDGMDNKLMSRYGLTSYFMLYLVRQALDIDEVGKEFCRDPAPIAIEIGLDNLKEVALRVSNDLVVDLNAELKEREGGKNPFDYKRELKSQAAVRGLAKDVIPGYAKAIKRNRATSFSAELEDARKATAQSTP